MKRGNLYRVYKGNKDDPKYYRVYLVISRQPLIDSQFPTVICAPIRSKYGYLPTQVEIGVNEGLKHNSAVYCDDLISLPKSMLTDYIGSLSDTKLAEISTALRVALAIE
jgi:mRNA interferase MazF